MNTIRTLPMMMWLSLGAALLAIALVMAPSSTVVVHATPIETDDCTDVPDTGANFNFHAPCQVHDVCYGTYGGGQRTAAKELARSNCDAQFYTNMNASCTAAYVAHQITAPGYASCRSTAQVYYAGVRLFGASFFYGQPI